MSLKHGSWLQQNVTTHKTNAEVFTFCDGLLILIAVTVKSTMIWNVTMCGLAEVH